MKPGTPKLSEVARKVAAPTGIVSTMWPSVERTCRVKLGLSFDPWQSQSGRLALAKRADGTMAATIDGVGMSICRQAGKTHWMTGLIFGLSINRPGTLTVWSAHHARTHGETFLSMASFAERSRVAPYIEQVFTGSGTEEVRFRNGSRILFGARERGFGRGIPGVDIIVADEAQIMTENAVDAMTATLNTSKFGLAFYLGTPPKPADPSEAFSRMRESAWSGELSDGVWIEFGAAPGVDPHSPDTWKKVNPSYPHRTPRESMLRLQRKLSPESFLREGLGIWDGAASGGVISAGVWASLADDGSGMGGAPNSLGVAAHDGQFSVVGCWVAGEQRFVEEVFAHRRLDLVASWLVEAGKRVPVLTPSYGAAAPLAEILQARRVRARAAGLSVVSRGCEILTAGCDEKWLTHADQKALADSLDGSRKKVGRDGVSWTFDLKKSTQNAPIMATVLALAEAATSKQKHSDEPKVRKAVIG